MNMNKIGPDCEDIIHKYYHQMKMINVLTELKTKVIYCEDCDQFKVSLFNYKCSVCREPICDYCVQQESEYLEQMYESPGDDSFLCDHCYEIEGYLHEHMEETESDIAYAEEQLWREIHGCVSMSQMY